MGAIRGGNQVLVVALGLGLLIASSPAGAEASEPSTGFDVARTAPPPGMTSRMVVPAFHGEPGTVLADPGRFEQLSPLRQTWFARRYYLDRGDEDRVERSGAALLEIRRDAGLANVSPLAAALTLEAAELRGEGRRRLAVASARLAAELAPDLPAARWSRARAEMSEGAIGPAIGEAIAAMAAHWNNARLRVRLLGSLVLAGLGAGVVAVAAFLAAIVLRHRRLLFHDLGHALSDRVPRRPLLLVAGALLALPFLLGLGPAVGAVWLVTLFWVYLSRNERVTALGVLAAVILLPLALRIASGFVVFSAQEPSLLHTARDDEPVPSLIARMETLADAHPSDAEILSILGLLYKRDGAYEAALEALRTAAETRPQDWVNAGIVQYGLGDAQTAVEHFQRALDARPDLFSAHFNIAQLEYERARSEAANKALAEARAIDRARVERLQGLALSRNRKLVSEDAPTVTTDFLNRFLEESPPNDQTLVARAFDTERTTPMAAGFWKSTIGGPPLATLPLFGIGGVLVCLLLWQLTSGARPATPCAQCRVPVCVSCDGPPRPDRFCPRCVAAFVSAEDIDPQQRRAQEQKVERHRHVQARLRPLAGVLPGGGHLLAGRAVQGLAWCLPGATLLVWLASSNRLLPAEFVPTPAGMLATTSIGVATLGALVFFSIRGARRIQSE